MGEVLSTVVLSLLMAVGGYTSQNSLQLGAKLSAPVCDTQAGGILCCAIVDDAIYAASTSCPPCLSIRAIKPRNGWRARGHISSLCSDGR